MNWIEHLTRIQIISLLGSVLFLLGILECVRRQLLKEAYALLWLALGGGFLVLSAFPGLLELARHIGILYAPAALFLFLIFGIILILIQYSVVLSRRTEQIKTLTQETALLRHRIEQLEKNADSAVDGKPRQS